MFKIPFLFKIKPQEARLSKTTSATTKVLIALGNTGEKYKNTYHNVGFAYADYLANRNNQQFEKYKEEFNFFKLNSLMIVKPLGFMNNSGNAVSKILKHFNLLPEETVIIHDDSDLQLGEYKTSFNRGPAGHKGVESIARHLKTNNFTRVRIGIRKRPGKAGDFVLKKINKEDLLVLNELFSRIDPLNV
ncbi:aminoacyl-tRNA hydrolase [Patescibacteria group bacterium]|nr:aminoacyl-tRNA hydrolase [Patescibacteria group bacterium]